MNGRAAPPPVIGLALGSGAARGWAHLGVISALAREGIQPRVVAGASIGALVGAAYAAGEITRLEQWARGLKWQDVLGLLDVSFKSGLIKGERLIDFFRSQFVDRGFEQLSMPYACVATELASGREVWLREGSVSQAVHASLALPGLVAPVWRDGRLLVDGGLVDPVPVSLCRALGADLVIAVDLGADIVGRALRAESAEAEEGNGNGNGFGPWSQRLLRRLGLANEDAPSAAEEETPTSLPSLLTVLTASINIMQVRIARSRLAGEPADVLLAPRLAQVGLLEFHRAEEAIAEGEAAVARMLPAIRHALALA